MKINVSNMHGVTEAELQQDFARCSGFVKMIMGSVNNCAYLVMMDCLDKLRSHPRYDRRIRRLFEGKTNSVLAFYKEYRNGLRWPVTGSVRFFHVTDMTPQAKKAYSDTLTDEQYFELWESTGDKPYSDSRPWVTSLANKYRLSLLSHGVPHPDITAWGLVGSAILTLAFEQWQRSINSIHAAIPMFRKDMLEKVYRPFSLEKIQHQWVKGFFALAPETDGYTLTSLESKNIGMGVAQLRELWCSPQFAFDATIASVDDYSEEIFRTKGYAKKAMRELSEMRNEAMEEVMK